MPLPPGSITRLPEPGIRERTTCKDDALGSTVYSTARLLVRARRTIACKYYDETSSHCHVRRHHIYWQQQPSSFDFIIILHTAYSVIVMSWPRAEVCRSSKTSPRDDAPHTPDTCTSDLGKSFSFCGKCMYGTKHTSCCGTVV